MKIGNDTVQVRKTRSSYRLLVDPPIECVDWDNEQATCLEAIWVDLPVDVDGLYDIIMAHGLNYDSVDEPAPEARRAILTHAAGLDSYVADRVPDLYFLAVLMCIKHEV